MTFFLLASGSLLALVPGITSVQNPASNIVTGLPNYGIASGSIFVIYGSQLGPSSLAQAQTLPFTTTLAGTSVKVIADSISYDAPVIYTLSSQIAAIMPSGARPGPATVTVTYNGFVGGAFSTTIVANNFGISTLNQSGNGGAVVTYPTSSFPFYGIVGPANSAVPGNTYTIWGTGLGAAANGNTDTNVSVFASVGPQVHVFVGGIDANVSYFGRSPGAGPGLDQINFTVPSGLTGCNVSLIVTTAGSPGTISNSTTIPVASGGGTCSDTFAIPASTWSPLLSLSGGANLSFFQIALVSATTYQSNQPTTNTGSTVIADFRHYTESQLSSQYSTAFAPAVSLGSCAITTTYPSNGSATPTLNYTALDAGQNVNFNSFSGAVYPLGKQPTGVYEIAASTFFGAGTYKMTDGAGGTGVGNIGQVSMVIPTFPTWTNQSSFANADVTRANGLTLTWSGGTAVDGSYMDIRGSAPFGITNKGTIAFECAAPVSADQFTVPASILSLLPVTNVGTLQLSEYIQTLSTIPGMDLGVISVVNTSSTTLNWN
ncbi:MAG TPA: hypothetical protein VHC90_06485 [Bryobacteraceae bacterium]|nr:hypothetical protein [Bryobacteraceae bacterium]